MTKFNSADIGYLLLGKYDLNNVTETLTEKVSDPVKETTPFGVSAAQFEKPGVKTHTLEGVTGWYDSDASSVQGAMVGLAAGENVFMFASTGNVAGRIAQCAGGVLKTGFERQPSVGEFIKDALELVVSGVMDDATIVCPLVQVSGNGNTDASYIDLGATGGGTTGANYYMACTAMALTGSTNLIITDEDSADHITWADNCVFTALTAAGAEKKVGTDMTVNRYHAVKRVWTGLAGTPTATFTVAIKVNSPH
jgi:hypothetical protein